jgi:type I restriction enzyme S subunit
MMNYQNVKKYPAYKDSGLEWIGEIPVGWKVEYGKWLFKKKDRKIRKSDETITCFRDGQVTLRKNRRVEGFTNAIKEHGYQGVRKGDLVIHAMDAFAGAIGVSDSDGKSTPVYAVCTPQKINSVNQYYYAYFLRSLALNGFIKCLAKGIRERSTDFRFNDFRELILPYPPLEEQTAIANFLDKKCSKIDRAVAQKEKLVALLKERKQIVIQNAVTKGLNPNAKMKDSRVEWIGEIPEGWEVQRLASFGKFTKGGGFSKSDLQEKGERAILYGDIYTIYDYFFIDAKKFISSNNSKKSSEIKKGDLLFTGSGETLEDIGKCVAFYGNKKTYAGGDIIIFKQSRYNSLYLSYALNSELLKQEKAKTAKGEIIVHTYASKLKNIYIPIPSLNIQAAIVSHIKTQSQKINKAITLQQNQIEKLKEYKSILINNAVTGKIKVC